MKVNVGCGPHYAQGWLNIDLVRTDEVRPDLIVADSLRPLAGVGMTEAVYLGHVLEHIQWDEVAPFLSCIRSHLVGGPLCIVGPDVNRVLAAWHAGTEPWELVTDVLEHHRPQADLGDWPGARHAWNCTEERVVDAMTEAGFARVTPLPITAEALADWPVVALTQWQCAVVGWES